MSHKNLSYTINDRSIRAYWTGESWTAEDEITGEYICRVFHEGSQYTSSAYPAKKWKSIEQAIQYTLTMRDRER